MSDGASGILLCSEDYLEGQSQSVRQRAVKVRATVMGGGSYRQLGDRSVTYGTARRAYERAGLNSGSVDVAEVHDATSFCEIYQTEMLGLCSEGEGAAWAESGATSLNAKLPINPSGGLISKGHPLAATGLSMLDELVIQLRGEAGQRQVGKADIGLQQNAGGLVGLDEALCSVVLLGG
jgi:acetyl-CoA acetyltransferase